MRLRDVMTKSPICCTPEMTIEDVSRMMAEHDCGAIPVVGDLDRRMPLGMITDRDIVLRSVAAGLDPLNMVVRDCMTAPALTVVEDITVHDCVQMLELGQIRRVIVVDEAGRVSGIVAQADIASHASKRETGDLVQQVSKPTQPAFAW